MQQKINEKIGHMFIVKYDIFANCIEHSVSNYTDN